MKSLSGANPESKPDYRQQALTELNKLESKVILLNEMLDNVDTTRGERFVAGDVYDVRPTSPMFAVVVVPDTLDHHTNSKLVPCFPARAQESRSGSPTPNPTIRNHSVSRNYHDRVLDSSALCILTNKPRHVPPN